MKTRVLLFLVPIAIILFQAIAMATSNLNAAWSHLHEAGQKERVQAPQPALGGGDVNVAEGEWASSLALLVNEEPIRGGVDPGNGFLQKGAAVEAHQWRHEIHALGYTTIINAVEQTADGGFVLCGQRQMTNGSTAIIMVKTDPSGRAQWTKIFSETDRVEDLMAVSQASDGGYIFAGKTALLNGDRGDGLIIKTDADGDMEWRNLYGDEAYQSFEDLQLEEDGSLVLVGMNNMGNEGSWLVRVKPSGELIWQTNQPAGWLFSVEPASDAGYLLAGEADNGAWVVKTDSEGNTEWQEHFARGIDDYARDARQIPDREYVVADTSQHAYVTLGRAH